jgi:hypothetical protein
MNNHVSVRLVLTGFQRREGWGKVYIKEAITKSIINMSAE